MKHHKKEINMTRFLEMCHQYSMPITFVEMGKIKIFSDSQPYVFEINPFSQKRLIKKVVKIQSFDGAFSNVVID